MTVLDVLLFLAGFAFLILVGKARKAAEAHWTYSPLLINLTGVFGLAFIFFFFMAKVLLVKEVRDAGMTVCWVTYAITLICGAPVLCAWLFETTNQSEYEKALDNQPPSNAVADLEADIADADDRRLLEP